MTDQKPNRSKPCPAKPGGRSRSIHIYWGVALTLLLAAGLLSWLAVVPHMRRQAELREVHECIAKRVGIWNQLAPWEFRCYFFESAPKAIIDLGGPEVAARKVTAYIEEHPEPVRYVAAGMLALCGEHGTAKLLELLQDKQARGQAAGLLGYTGDKRAVLPLIETLKDEDELTCCFAAESLGMLGGPPAIEALEATLKDERTRVRQAAAEVLGKLGAEAKESAPALEKLSIDRDMSVRKAAAEALKKIKARSTSSGQAAQEQKP